MIKPIDCFNELWNCGVRFFCGVPDSLLKEFCACITDKLGRENHVITANEGNAVALAAGHFLASQNPGVVYMQNSGQGNIINPLLSLTDADVYRIPLLMFIGWRGAPDIHDEPQHITQGKLTLPLLDVINVKYEIFEDVSQISNAIKYIQETGRAFAFIVRKGTFEKYEKSMSGQAKYPLSREQAIQHVLSKLSDKDIVVSTTGMISRELYENRPSHEKDFLTVGSMGHASSIALGIAMEKAKARVFCFDGDGACLMHMGALPVIASRNLKNYRHILFNNEVHDSVGAQPTVASNVNFTQIALGAGYDHAFSVQTLDELINVWDDFYNSAGTNMLEIKVRTGNRADLGRPKEKPEENKNAFMHFVQGC